MAYLRAGIDGGRQGSSLVRNRVMDIRGDLATGGRLVLSTTEPTVVDGNELGRIDFQAPLDTAGTDAILVAASIYAEADNTFSSSVNATELVFATGASETAAEKMRITSDGKVGIGVTTPASLLHVAGTVQVGVDDLGHDVKFFGATSGSYMLWDESTDDLILGGVARLGIGTTAPETKLTIDQSADNDGIRLYAYDDMAAYYGEIYLGSDGYLNVVSEGDRSLNLRSGSSMNLKVNENSSAITALHITNAGNVGIGTTAPETKLTIDQSADNDGIRLYAYDDMAAYYGEIYLGSDGYLNVVSEGDRSLNLRSGSSMNLKVNENSSAITALHIKNDGNVGIGTTAPGTDLVVLRADSDAEILTTVTGDYFSRVQIERTGGSSKTDRKWSFDIGSDGGLYVEDKTGAATPMAFSIAGQVTTPLQPNFGVKASSQNNMAINSNNTLTFGTEDYDIGTNWDSNVFTAPVTGKYLMCITANLYNIDQNASAFGMHLRASNRIFESWWGTAHWDTDGKITCAISHVIDMDASDTVYWYFYQSGGGAQTNLHADTRWTGMLVG